MSKCPFCGSEERMVPSNVNILQDDLTYGPKLVPCCNATKKNMEYQKSFNPRLSDVPTLEEIEKE